MTVKGKFSFFHAGFSTSWTLTLTASFPPAGLVLRVSPGRRMAAYLVTTSFGGASKKHFYLDHNVEFLSRFVSTALGLALVPFGLSFI